MTLTGKIRHRVGLLGKCVLQVEYTDLTDDKDNYVRLWRDARVEDLSELTALVFSKIDVYLPQVPEFSEEGKSGSRKAN